eukprot:g13171.t2
MSDKKRTGSLKKTCDFFWLTDGDAAPALTRAGGRSVLASSPSGGERLWLPLERSRFSASPATGLVGLQENVFLTDFFACLGFLSLTSHGNVSGICVSIQEYSTCFCQVRRYVELAEDSLLVCFDGDVSTARAYVAMALLYNFLGDQVKVDEYTKLTKNRVELVPPEEIPRGFRDVLQYAGFAKLSEKVMERDICGLVLSVNMWINKPFSEVALADRMLGTLEQQPSKVASVATHPPMENLDMFNAKAYHYCPDSVEACEEVKKKSVLHELLRVKEGIEKSGMHAGIGGILYYGSLAYLQLLHRLPGARISCEKMLRVFLRYPGLCRFNHWLHTCHVLLDTFAVLKSEHDYENLRASYNSARPVECRPAPPFDEWREISDIRCRVKCRRFAMQLRVMILDMKRGRCC